MAYSTAADAIEPGAGVDAQAWLFMRASGLVLLLLAVGHLLYMHLVTGVTHIDYDWILARWANPVWRFYDWLLLGLAVLHGTNGVRNVVDDWWRPGLANTGLKWLLYLAAVALLLAGTQIIVTAPKP
jgi:succinate dehydrogenase / fumarate reductase membrane anchor subunit